MKTFLFVLGLIGLFTPILSAADAPQPMLEITFVASAEELKIAEEAKDHLKGLAVSQEFYRQSPAEEKVRVEELARFLIQKAFRPVLFYGKQLDVPRIVAIFGKEGRLNNKCVSPPAYIGIYPTNVVRGVMGNATLWLCDRPYSEEEYRSYINEGWAIQKKYLEENGFGTNQ